MKHLFLIAVLGSCISHGNSQLAYNEKPKVSSDFFSANTDPEPSKVLQLGQEGRMSAAMFKNQEYCRAELERFEFDAHFSVISATVYFSGANFHGAEKTSMKGNSLKQLSSFTQRCMPGSIVTFDDVKVVGPDNKIRTIPGTTYVLY